MERCILVATDGKAGALGALRTARWLAERDRSRVEVVSVHAPINLYGIGTLDMAAGAPGPVIQASIESLRANVRSQLERVGGPAPGWNVTVEVGPVTPLIARLARRVGAALVLVGLAEGSGVGHWRSRETVVDLVHLLHVPVLAIPPEAVSLPSKAVVAVDFSEFSIRAAREALHEIGPAGALHLAYVMPDVERDGAWQPVGGWDRYVEDLHHRLADVADEFGRGREGATTYVRVGDPGIEILRLGRELGADLIATGSHGDGFLGRLLLGSVAGGIIHRATCAVLTAPPECPPPELDLTKQELLRNLGRAGEMLPPPA